MLRSPASMPWNSRLKTGSSSPMHAGQEVHAKFAIRNLPILHAFAADIGDDEPVLRREFHGIDAGLLNIERQRVTDEQTRFLEPDGGAVGHLHERLDALEVRCEREGASVESI